MTTVTLLNAERGQGLREDWLALWIGLLVFFLEMHLWPNLIYARS